jgi:hypothetical protein
MAYERQISQPDARTKDFVCPVCETPMSLEISPEAWETMASNNAFGWPWTTMLPRGVTLGRLVRFSDQERLEEGPAFMHLDAVQRLYTPMHRRCHRVKQKALVAARQAACPHDHWTWQWRCPDCYQTTPMP